MVVKWFVYQKDGGVVWLALPAAPDNADYLESGEVWLDGTCRARGVKWDSSAVWEGESGVEIDSNSQYLYDVGTNELIDLGGVLL